MASSDPKFGEAFFDNDGCENSFSNEEGQSVEEYTFSQGSNRVSDGENKPLSSSSQSSSSEESNSKEEDIWLLIAN